MEMPVVKKVALLAGLTLIPLLGGCANRQAIRADAEESEVAVPNDTGGYAGDLAEPPAESVVVDVESIIASGTESDPRESMEQEQPEEHPEDEHKEEEPADETPATKDTSNDSRWATVQNPVAAIQTNKGVVYVELYPDVAPKHVANFEKLAKDKFFDGIFIHRVEPGFVVQAGDPLTKIEGPQGPRVGTGGPGWTVPAEFNDKPHLRGTLSMARSADPDSAGSQFFICLDRAAQLDKQYTVFGQVLGEGMEVVDKLQVGDRMQFVWMVHD